MRRRLLLLAAVAALPAPAYAFTLAENPKLTATVGPAFNISLTDAAGNTVTKLDPGPYVDEATTVAGTGTFNWTVTFRDGRYTFVCDPHNTDMRGSFVAGNPPPPPPPAPKPTRLTAAVRPAHTIS